VALHTMYLLSLDITSAEVGRRRALLADVQVEFRKPVYSRQPLYARLEAIAWRLKKLCSRAESHQPLASGVLSGMGAVRA
jgi:hypothetical protein